MNPSDDERPHWREPAEAQRAYEQSCTVLGDLLATSQWNPLGAKQPPVKVIAALRKSRELRKEAATLRAAWDRKIAGQQLELARRGEELKARFAEEQRRADAAKKTALAEERRADGSDGVDADGVLWWRST